MVLRIGSYSEGVRNVDSKITIVLTVLLGSESLVRMELPLLVTREPGTLHMASGRKRTSARG